MTQPDASTAVGEFRAAFRELVEAVLDVAPVEIREQLVALMAEPEKPRPTLTVVRGGRLEEP